MQFFAMDSGCVYSSFPYNFELWNYWNFWDCILEQLELFGYLALCTIDTVGNVEIVPYIETSGTTGMIVIVRMRQSDSSTELI